ncbi:TPA: TIGR01906 family membrane protein [Bacillus cereus]|nr:TIGR01906 family membrane protein [Bacillus cereus]
MKKNKSGTKILDRLITIVVSYSIAFSIFALATTAVVYGKWLYYFEIDFLNIPDLADMTKGDIKRNYNVLITYLSPFYDGALHLPTLDMSTNGRIHFVDVKNILVKIQYVMYATIMIAMIGGMYLLKKKNEKFLLHGSILTIIFPIALMLPIAINFEKSFVIFHKLLFSNDYWVFDPEKDPIILMLPEEFFMHAACAILLFILFGSILCYSLYRYFLKKKRMSNKKFSAQREFFCL